MIYGDFAIISNCKNSEISTAFQGFCCFFIDLFTLYYYLCIVLCLKSIVFYNQSDMKNHTKVLAAIMLMTAVIITVGCKPDLEVTVTTCVPHDITTTSAVCGGEVTLSQEVEVDELGVCWGVIPNPTVADTNVSTSSWSDWGEPFVCVLSDLEAGTEYHVRAYAIIGRECYYGEDKCFITLEDNGNTGLDPDTVEHLEPSISIIEQEGFVHEGMELLVNESYRIGFVCRANAQTDVQLAKFVIKINNMLWVDSIISGTEFFFDQEIHFVECKRGETYPVTIDAIVMDEASETASATINITVTNPDVGLTTNTGEAK